MQTLAKMEHSATVASSGYSSQIIATLKHRVYLKVRCIKLDRDIFFEYYFDGRRCSRAYAAVMLNKARVLR